MRLFISIDLPSELHDHCRKLQKRFPGMKNTEEFHLTIQFLGDNIHEQFLPRINEALGKIEFKPFEIKLGQPRRFPNEFEPKGVWIDCDGGEALKDLADRIRKIMDKTGFRPDDSHAASRGKPFAAHITLGRYKKVPFGHSRAGGNLVDPRFREDDKGGGNDRMRGGRPQPVTVRSRTTSPEPKTETKTFMADRFLLMQSHLGSDGPTYKILSEFPASV